MNLNILSYGIYLPIIIVITVKIGWMFYTHGEIFLLHLFQHHIAIVKPINNILLTGYYLVNIGYAIYAIAQWESILTIPQMLNILCGHLGSIIIGLAILHYNNVFWLNYLVKSKPLKL